MEIPPPLLGIVHTTMLGPYCTSSWGFIWFPGMVWLICAPQSSGCYEDTFTQWVCEAVGTRSLGQPGMHSRGSTLFSSRRPTLPRRLEETRAFYSLPVFWAHFPAVRTGQLFESSVCAMKNRLLTTEASIPIAHPTVCGRPAMLGYARPLVPLVRLPPLLTW